MSSQSHHQFKLFLVDFSNNKIEESSKKEVLEFVNQDRIVAKSIGIEHLDNQLTVVICVGYSVEQNNKSYDIQLNKIGKYKGKETLSNLESSLNQVASSYKNIICHEFLIDEEKDMYTIFLLEN